MTKSLSREFIAERDTRILKMRQAGISVTEIARRFGITASACNSAIQRQLQKLNREALLAYPEVLRMELERLDTLQQSIWPLTQHRKVTLPDGTETTVEPDLKAIQQVLAIMDRRSKLLGMEQTNISVTMEPVETPQRAALAGGIQTESVKHSPEEEARKLLELMGASGILPDDVVQDILKEPLQLEAPVSQPTIEPRKD
jgi:transposase-like protein